MARHTCRVNKELAVSNNPEASPAGATLVGIYILEHVGFSKYVDQILDEEHTTIAQLRHSWHNRPAGEKLLMPSSGTILSLMAADMVARPRDITRAYQFTDAAENWYTGPLLGIEPKYLNDDRIGNVMSALGMQKGGFEEILFIMIMDAGKKADIPLDKFILDLIFRIFGSSLVIVNIFHIA